MEAEGRMRPKMTVSDRAKQFAPFAALTGLTETLSKKERVVVERPVLSEESLKLLDERMSMVERGKIITVLYYSKGECIKISGMVAKVEHSSRILQIVSTRIPFDDIIDLDLQDQ